MSGRWWRRGLPIALAAGALLAACSLLVPLNEEQCTVSSDCAARGGAFAGAVCLNNVCVASNQMDEAGADAAVDAGPWGCLGQLSELTTGLPVTTTFFIANALDPITTAGPSGGSDLTVLTYTPVPGITLEGCNPLDVLCSSPVTAAVVSDDAGGATVVVPDDFSGFFQFVGSGYLPSKVYVGHLLADASTFQAPFPMLDVSGTLELASVLKVPMYLDPEAGVGHFFFQVYDCFDHVAPGVSFSLAIDGGPDTVQWYLTGGVPSTVATATDTEGAGGTLNVPAGAVLVTATLAGTKQIIGTVNVVVVAGSATYGWVRVRTQ